MAEVQEAEYDHDQEVPAETVILDDGTAVEIQGDNPAPGPSTLPQTGDTFVVMEEVENYGSY